MKRIRPNLKDVPRPNLSIKGPLMTWPIAIPIIKMVTIKDILLDSLSRPISGLISSKAGSEESIPKAVRTLRKAR
jgi:hypothetical protein